MAEPPGATAGLSSSAEGRLNCLPGRVSRAGHEPPAAERFDRIGNSSTSAEVARIVEMPNSRPMWTVPAHPWQSYPNPTLLGKPAVAPGSQTVEGAKTGLSQAHGELMMMAHGLRRPWSFGNLG